MNLLSSASFDDEVASVEKVYSQHGAGYGSIAKVSQAHHVNTNVGKWIHVVLVQNEQVYNPANYSGEKITMPKEHSLFIYNPALDDVADLSTVPLQKLINQENDQAVLMRIHSLCRFGDAFGSVNCDCGPQLMAARKAIVNNGSGMIVYLEQEGRNVGLCVKAALYHVEESKGVGTHRTFAELGFRRNDLRNYQVVDDVFTLFQIKKAELMTNNPNKFRLLTQNGRDVKQRAISVPANEHNIDYLLTKKEHMGHGTLAPATNETEDSNIKIAKLLHEMPELVTAENVEKFQRLVEEERARATVFPDQDK